MLMRLGVILDWAIKHAISRKGYWRMSRTMPAACGLAEQMAGATRTSLLKATLVPSLLLFAEPPSADPHARWCGEGARQRAPLPDACSISFLPFRSPRISDS